MENKTLVIRNLVKLTEEEHFYRGYYKAAKKGLQKQYVKIADYQDEWLQDILDMEKHYGLSTETMFMTPDRNIEISKHPRYMPCYTHSHTFFEIAYVLFGDCRQVVENHPLHLTEGDFCMLAPGVRHSIDITDDDTILLNILIRYDVFVDIFYSLLRNKSHISTFFNSPY